MRCTGKVRGKLWTSLEPKNLGARRPLERAVPWSLTGTHDQTRQAEEWSQARVKFAFASMTGWTLVHSQKSGTTSAASRERRIVGHFPLSWLCSSPSALSLGLSLTLKISTCILVPWVCSRVLSYSRPFRFGLRFLSKWERAWTMHVWE